MSRDLIARDSVRGVIPSMSHRDLPGQTDALLESSLHMLVAVRRVHEKLSEADGEGVAQILSLNADQLALLMQAWTRLAALVDSFCPNCCLFHIPVRSSYDLSQKALVQRKPCVIYCRRWRRDSRTKHANRLPSLDATP